MVEAIPSQFRCRSNDCGMEAEYEVRLICPKPDGKGRYSEGREWKGKFCWTHLKRVLPARLQMLSSTEYIEVVKITRKAR